MLGLLTTAAVGPVLYPAWLGLRTRRVADPTPPVPGEWPAVTVVVPAYREQSVIGAKIENTLANAYPGDLHVVVIAEDPETFAAAQKTPAQAIGMGVRRGKAGALNLGVAAADTPVVVLTDANTMLEPGALESLVRWLADPTIGAVAGEKRVARGEGFYWSFESWLKQREWRTGTTIGVGGELVALRTDVYRELPTDIAVDDLWLALDVIDAGYRIAYDPRAVGSEPGGPTLSGEWERRTRVVAAMIDAVWRRRSMLVPGRSPATGQLWGHRLVRASAGPLSHAVLLAIALRDVRRTSSARLFLAAHAFGLWSFACERRGRHAPRLGRMLGQALFLQAVGVGGTLRFLRRDRLARWPKPERPPLPDGAGVDPLARTPEKQPKAA